MGNQGLFATSTGASWKFNFVKKLAPTVWLFQNQVRNGPVEGQRMLVFLCKQMHWTVKADWDHTVQGFAANIMIQAAPDFVATKNLHVTDNHSLGEVIKTVLRDGRLCVLDDHLFYHSRTWPNGALKAPHMKRYVNKYVAE